MYVLSHAFQVTARIELSACAALLHGALSCIIWRLARSSPSATRQKCKIYLNGCVARNEAFWLPALPLTSSIHKMYLLLWRNRRSVASFIQCRRLGRLVHRPTVMSRRSMIRKCISVGTSIADWYSSLVEVLRLLIFLPLTKGCVNFLECRRLWKHKYALHYKPHWLRDPFFFRSPRIKQVLVLYVGLRWIT